MTGYQRILFPTDFSELAEAACEHAKLLAKEFRAELHVLHVVEDPLSSMTLADSYTLPEEILKAAEAQARTSLMRILSVAQQTELRAVNALRTGSPFVEIVRYAREEVINLIVMGTKGRGPIAHMLLGSVAEQVLRKAPCPVLVVRKGLDDLVMP